MKLRNSALERLVEEDDPVQPVWDILYDIWSADSDSVADHYTHETQASNFERLLLDVYGEFYDTLADRCVNNISLPIPENGTFVVMDAMSVREAPLFVDVLDSMGYDVDVGYSYSAIPSETKFYRDRIDYRGIKREHKTVDVKSRDPTLDGDEDLVWCRFPDALLETIQEGKTELSTIDEAYEKTEDAFRAIVDQLEADRIVFGSDHGYVRLDAGHAFPVSEKWKNRLQEVFTGGRFVSVAEGDANDLVKRGIVAEADGWYLPIGRHTWPARGKYSTFQHGGLSLHECLTPRINATLK